MVLLKKRNKIILRKKLLTLLIWNGNWISLHYAVADEVINMPVSFPTVLKLGEELSSAKDKQPEKNQAMELSTNESVSPIATANPSMKPSKATSSIIEPPSTVAGVLPTVNVVISSNPTSPPKSNYPTLSPTLIPTSSWPTSYPTLNPTPLLSSKSASKNSVNYNPPTNYPTNYPTYISTSKNSVNHNPPTNYPTYIPTWNPTWNPTTKPTLISFPSKYPGRDFSASPSYEPSYKHTSYEPSYKHTSYEPSYKPTLAPTMKPTLVHTNNPTDRKTSTPSQISTTYPSKKRSKPPTNFKNTLTSTSSLGPSDHIISLPSLLPRSLPSLLPTLSPTRKLNSLRMDRRSENTMSPTYSITKISSIPTKTNIMSEKNITTDDLHPTIEELVKSTNMSAEHQIKDTSFIKPNLEFLTDRTQEIGWARSWTTIAASIISIFVVLVGVAVAISFFVFRKQKPIIKRRRHYYDEMVGANHDNKDYGKNSRKNQNESETSSQSKNRSNKRITQHVTGEPKGPLAIARLQASPA